jgi:hypothetical protein
MVDRHLVTLIALIFGGISFLVYLIEVGVALWTRPAASARAVVEKAAQTHGLSPEGAPSIGDLTRLLDAIAHVTDSLSRAGPSLTALIAAVLFMAIAAVSSGALRSGPEPHPLAAPQQS